MFPMFPFDPVRQQMFEYYLGRLMENKDSAQREQREENDFIRLLKRERQKDDESSDVLPAALTLVKEAEYPWGSQLGKEAHAAAESLKERGTAALNAKQYEMAAMLYSDGMKVAIKVFNNEEQLAKLFSNRAHVHILTKEYKAAKQDALICIQLRPTWYKGPRRLMQILKAEGLVVDAVTVGNELVINYQMSEEEKTQLCQDILVMADGVPGGFKPLRNLRTDRDHWLLMLQRLVKYNHWHVIHTLLHGNHDVGALLADFKFKPGDIQLASLLEKSKVDDWISWGEQLTETLIDRGVPYMSLSIHGHGLHAALLVASRTGSYKLLECLFRKYIPTGDRDRTDQDGNTLLHTACMNTFATQEEAIKLLLKEKVASTKKNSAGKLPLELLGSDSPCRTMLLADMTKRGFNCQQFDKKKQNTSQNSTSASNPTTTNSQTTNSPPTSLVNATFTTNQWTVGEVKKWLDLNNLDSAKNKLKGTSGKQLVELRFMLETAPKYFYESVGRLLDMDQLQLISLGSALRQLV